MDGKNLHPTVRLLGLQSFAVHDRNVRVITPMNSEQEMKMRDSS